MQEKVRIFALARELDMESKDLLNVCRQAGIDVKNQLSTLDPDQRDLVVQMVRKGQSAPAGPAVQTATLQAPPGKIRILDKRPPVLTPRPPAREPEPAPKAEHPAPTVQPSSERPSTTVAPAILTPPCRPCGQNDHRGPDAAAASRGSPRPAETPAAKAPEPAARPAESPPAAPQQPVAAKPTEPTAPPTADAGRTAASTPPARNHGQPPMRNLDGGQRPTGERHRRIPPRPTQQQIRVAPPPQMKITKPPDNKQPPPPPAGPRKIGEIPKELQSKDGGPITIEQIIKEHQKPSGTKPPVAPGVEIEAEDEEGAKGKGGVKPRPGALPGREERHKLRNERQAKRKQSGDVVEVKGKSIAALLSDEGPRYRKYVHKKKVDKGPKPRIGKVPISLPITVRSLSEAIGMKHGELAFKLMTVLPGQTITINSTLDLEVAETFALEQGVELNVKRQLDVEEELLASFRKPDEPDQLAQPRPRS